MSRAARGGRTLAEWLTLAASIAIVGSLIAVALIEEANRQDEDPARLVGSFDSGAVRHVGDEYFVPYAITNAGAEAVSSADIWIEVYDGEVLVESAEITVQFLPLQGRQEGVYVSGFDPATHTLRSRLESIQFP